MQKQAVFILLFETAEYKKAKKAAGHLSGSLCRMVVI